MLFLLEGLRDFYRKNIFRFATFADLQKSFEHVSHKDLQPEFDQWITQTGAPELKISDVVVTETRREICCYCNVRTEAGRHGVSPADTCCDNHGGQGRGVSGGRGYQ